MKILLATQKPFSTVAVDKMKEIAKNTSNDLILLESYKEKSEIENAVKNADALIVRSDKVTADVVSASNNLKIVVRAGAGYDNVDLEACSKKSIVVMNTPGQNSNAVAELTLGFMIYMSRNSFTPGTGTELKGKKLGIHAYGNVGKLVASLGKGFGMEIYAFDPFVSEETFKNEGVIQIKTAKQLYSECDIISINIPAIASTIKSINKELLSDLKKGAMLINTARKEVINEQDLFDIMKNRTDIKYATDIKPDSHEQMLEFGSRYFATPNKMGAETEEANVNAAVAAITQIADFFNTGNEKYRVN